MPVLEGAPLPNAGRKAEDNARYCAVFFRPWTLLPGTADVPELRHLGATPTRLRSFYEGAQLLVRRRMSKCGPRPPPNSMKAEEALRWAEAWDEYIRGSLNAEGEREVTFLLSTHAGSSRPSLQTRWGEQVSRRSRSKMRTLRTLMLKFLR